MTHPLVNPPSSIMAGYREREAALLASYAAHSADSAGRERQEPDHPYRAPFQRDRDRILHSAAFRRLSYKTQVFTGELGDYHRTRLTHTLEVASVARTMSRAMRLNEDLTEALALLHDVGHPPFGHAGEETLNLRLAQHGGFDHNRQALRIVEQLEKPYPGVCGLNLSREVLQGQSFRARKKTAQSSPGKAPLLEVQVVDAADSVGYDTHDADDALQLGLLSLEDLAEVPLWRETVGRVHKRWADLAGDELRRAAIHELIDFQVSNLLEETTQRLEEQSIQDVAAVRRAGILVRPSSELAEQKAELEAFLFQRVYRHPDVLSVRRRVQEWLDTMFAGYVRKPGLLPSGFRRLAENQGPHRAVGDYLAGMTDRFAQQQFRECRFQG